MKASYLYWPKHICNQTIGSLDGLEKNKNTNFKQTRSQDRENLLSPYPKRKVKVEWYYTWNLIQCTLLCPLNMTGFLWGVPLGEVCHRWVPSIVQEGHLCYGWLRQKGQDPAKTDLKSPGGGQRGHKCHQQSTKKGCFFKRWGAT